MTKEFQSQKKLFKTEKVLYQNLEILPTIFELSPDAVALTRVSDGKFIYFNQEYLKQIGYSSDELKNHTTQELNLYADSNRQEYIDSLKRDKIVTNFELKVKRKDGSFIDVLYSARYINVDGEEVLLNIGKDITEHKKAEQQIKNDANLMDQLYDAVIRTDTNFKINYWNHAAKKVFGYSQDEALGMNTVELLRPIYAPGEREVKSKELKDNGILKTINRFRHKNGMEIIIEQNATQIKDNSGVLIGYVVIYHDITQQKKAELLQKKLLKNEQQLTEELQTSNEELQYTTEELRVSNEELQSTTEELRVSNEELQSTTEELQVTNEELRNQGHELLQINNALAENEKKYRSIIETANEGVMITDPNAIVLFVNAKMAEILGYSIEELIGMDSFTLIDKTEIEDAKKRVADWKKGIRGEYEIKFLKKNGEVLWAHGSVSPIYDHDGVHNSNLTMYTDITERKKAEKHLKQSEKLLNDIINGFPSPIFVKDIEGRFLTINNKLEKLLGVKNEELKGKTDYDIITKELADYYRFNDKKVIEEGKAIAIEEEADLIDGHHTFIANKFPIYDINGKPYGVGSISTDITDRKLLEEKVKKRTEELSKFNIELKRSNEELERFAYVSSHDLQEPLRMVTLYSQLLERRYKDNLDSDANDFIEYIVEGAQRMKQLIDDLLEYSRVKSQAAEFEKVNLEQVLDIVLHNLAISIVENNVTISHDPLPSLFVDKNQMVQVFQNLISNAIKFHGQNPPEINISAQKDKNEWIFSVSDNGIGIKPEHHKQIFEVFKRLNTREEYSGTGIGLSITQKIIQHHAGQIWVESQPRKETTFFFTIPIKT